MKSVFFCKLVQNQTNVSSVSSFVKIQDQRQQNRHILLTFSVHSVSNKVIEEARIPKGYIHSTQNKYTHIFSLTTQGFQTTQVTNLMLGNISLLLEIPK